MTKLNELLSVSDNVADENFDQNSFAPFNTYEDYSSCGCLLHHWIEKTQLKEYYSFVQGMSLARDYFDLTNTEATYLFGSTEMIMYYFGESASTINDAIIRLEHLLKLKSAGNTIIALI